MASSGSAARFAALLQGEIVDTSTLQVQLIPIVHHVLERLGFAPTVERFCGDEGDVEAWKILEAFVHSRVASQAPVPVSRIEEWITGTVLPHMLDAPAEKFNEYRFGRVIEAAGMAPRALWIELVRAAHQAYGFDLSWDIYDTSSIHFEGEYTRSDPG